MIKAVIKKRENLILKQRWLTFASFLVAFLFLHALARSVRADDLARGMVIEKVACLANAEQSYALYLPANYTPGKTWPVLYGFDPIARGPVPVRRFKEAAEKYGYVVVGSNNSRNGPVKLATTACEAMWNDTHARLAIANDRAYATGFSGGARAANFVATLCENCVAGVISCGAGFTRAYPPTKQNLFAVFATVGVDDFNYPELVELNAALEKYGIPHRIATFDGSHSWPLAETVRGSYRMDGNTGYQV